MECVTPEKRLQIPDTFYGRRKELACLSGQEATGTRGPIRMRVKGKMCEFAL